jgi:ribosomal protein S18 acetylase RimI-like enzyme
MIIQDTIDARPVTPEDYPALARLLADNFRGKFAVALGRDLQTRARRIEALLPSGVICPGYVYVVKMEGRVIASFTLKTAETTPSPAAYQQMRAILRATDGWLRAWWAGTTLHLLEGMKPGPQDCYLDNLVTDQAFRRQGIASRMARFVYELVRSWGKTTLWADVMSSNYRVIELLKKEGWEIVGRNYWVAPITWPLLGTAGIFRIRKQL